MNFKCDTCGREFCSKYRLKTHVEKNACKIYTHFCKYCGKGFTTETSMYRHARSSCPVKKKTDEEKNTIYEKLVQMEEKNKELQKMVIDTEKKFQKENGELKKKVLALENDKKSGNNINKGIIHNGDIHNGDNNNINIILVGYGKEDLSKIDKKDILKAIQGGYDSTIKLTETLHFNPKHPEYHNVYITNMKDKYAMMFDGKEWNLTMKEDLINKIYDDKKNYIEENIDEFIDSLTVSRKKALDRWLETEDDDARIIKIKDEIKLLLYNKRNLILDNHEDVKKCVKKSVKRAKKDNEVTTNDIVQVRKKIIKE